jgi:hypothetical protein
MTRATPHVEFPKMDNSAAEWISYSGLACAAKASAPLLEIREPLGGTKLGSSMEFATDITTLLPETVAKMVNDASCW